MDVKMLSADQLREVRKFKALNERAGTVEVQNVRRLEAVVKRNPEQFQSMIGKRYVRALSEIAQKDECQCLLCDRKAMAGDTFCLECGMLDLQKLEMEKRRNSDLQKLEVEKRRNSDVQKPEGRRPDVPESEYLKESYRKFAGKINEMTGERDGVQFRFRDLFSAVFRHHTHEEAEEIFIAGTSLTTPKTEDISQEWPKPWLYSRVLLYILAAYALLWVFVGQMGNSKGYPGLMFVGALSVPFSVVIFFWELNIPRNISLVEVVKVFLIGGILSLLCTMTIDSWLNVGELDFTGAMLTGFAEETAKAIALMLFLRKPKYQYILNGLLLGAAVGAGFAVFETAGYAFTIFLQTLGSNAVTLITKGYRVDELSQVADNLTMRGILAVGGHVAWTAFVGAGMMVVKKNQSLERQHITDPRFLKFLLIAIVLHGLWDSSPLYERMPLFFGFSSLYLILVALIWVILLVVIGAGLRQATRMANEAMRNV